MVLGEPRERKSGASRQPGAATEESGVLRSVSAAAVQAQLTRVLDSTEFRYSERLSRFIRYVVEQQLAGNASQLKEVVLAVEIFDRAPTYDSHVESIVRVEARRLRAKLERFYGDAGREDPVIIALPKGSYAPVFALRNSLPVARPEGPPAQPAAPRTFTARAMAGVSAAALLVGILLTVAWESRRPSPVPAATRLTADAGLTFEPALSPDGRLVAYSSDRGGTGHLEVWVQQVAGGSPVRVTTGPGDDREPSFSPDGTLIAYRTQGENPGVYVVPSFGGMSTLLAAGGLRPRFSPDGTRVAYWAGERSLRTAEIYVVPARGGTPSRLRPDFPYAAYPVWSPDGRYILFVGSRDPAGQPWITTANDWDWWLAPVAGGPAIQTFARKAFGKQGLQPPQTGWSHRRIVPAAWAASGEVYFSARSGEQLNVWRMRISPDARRVSGEPQAMTFGAGRQDFPALSADGAMVYSVLTSKSDVYTLPVDASAAKVRGPLARLTTDGANYTRPAVSRDGTRLAFLANRAGNYDVWVKDLQSGRETAVTTTRQDESVVALSPDGSKLAFGYAPPAAASIYTATFGSGKTAQLCSDCGEPRAWLPDGSGLLFQRFTRTGASFVGILDPRGRERMLMQSTTRALFSPSVSPDGRWIAFIVRTPPDEHRVAVAPMRAEVSGWVPVTQAGAWVDKPRWSPDGRTLYFFSNRDGFLCLWAQRLDPDRKPSGQPVPMAHLHGRQSPANVFGMELSVASDKLVLNMGEDSGNLWLSPPAR